MAYVAEPTNPNQGLYNSTINAYLSDRAGKIATQYPSSVPVSLATFATNQAAATLAAAQVDQDEREIAYNRILLQGA